MNKFPGELAQTISVRGGVTALAAAMLLSGTVSGCADQDPSTMLGGAPAPGHQRYYPIPVKFIEQVNDAHFSEGNRNGNSEGMVRDGVTGRAFCTEGQHDDTPDQFTIRVLLQSGADKGRVAGNVQPSSLAENWPKGNPVHDVNDYGVGLLPPCADDKN